MADAPEKPRVVGRYAVHDEIASGGMATVHLGRLLGPVGFARTVAIKRLHPQFSREPEFVSMFLDEARLAARIRHPNVVSTLDVVAAEGELFLVLEYVQGESFGRLLRAARQEQQPAPLSIVSAIVVDTLLGLHAAHTATDELGNGLDIVHRDVSPQNILVGADGVARVLDFGIAKATSRLQTTRNGQIKGKLAYMSPEQVEHRAVDARTDIFAVGIVLWEALTGSRLFAADNAGATLQRIVTGAVAPPSTLREEVSPELDALVLRALSRDRDRRFKTAREMAAELERVVPRASALVVGGWVERTVPQVLDARARRVAGVESQSASTPSERSPGLGSEAAQVEAQPIDKRLEPTHTDLSVSSSTSQEATPRRSRLLLGAIALALLGAGVALLWAGSAPDPDPGKLGGAAQETPPAPAAAAPGRVVSGSAPSALPPPSASASVTNKPRPLPATAPRRKPTPAKKKPSCDPPFYFDAAGNKRFKADCYPQ